jgi:hypothetical protein
VISQASSFDVDQASRRVSEPSLRSVARRKEERAMEKMVARLNIEHFRELVKKETDEGKRPILMRLLDEAEAKMKALNDPPKKSRTI